MTNDKLIQLFTKEAQQMGNAAAWKLELDPAMEREAFRIQPKEDGFLIRGADEKALAYGIQTLSETLKKQEGILKEDICGSPEVKIRGVDRFIMNTDDEVWWLDENYWEQYIQMLALSRMNRLCIATGFDTEYLSPPYPFFVDVDGFEDVKLAYPAAGNEKRLQMLRKIGQICHSYHMEFSFAIWQQQPWQKEKKQFVYGLEDQNRLCEYCAKGVQKLLEKCPEIDIIHYRVNYESGVGSEDSAEEYWLRQIEAVAHVNREIRPVRLELRAKGMTDRMVQHGCELGLDVTVSTKYCCEHAGLPHHLTQMRAQELAKLENMNSSRRYSYADMLKKPRNYDFIYRLWSNGSLTLFNWGDPDYVKRFVASMQLGDADGFEVIAPLTMRGGREFERHTGWQLFEDKKYQPDFEDGRYWLFYRLFGRIGYNSACGEEAWQGELNRRLGCRAELAERIVALSSKIMPFITAFHFPEHPQLWYWPELSTGAALFPEHNFLHWFRKEQDTYQDSPACDEGLFYSISEYVKAGENTDGRYTPLQVYDWLAQITEKLEGYLADAEPGDRQTQEKNMPAASADDRENLPADGWEWNGILLDARMTLHLARFHMHKILAAMGLAHYQYKNDTSYLQDSLTQMKLAKESWDQLAALGAAYHEPLDFSAGVGCQRKGHWKDYCHELELDIQELEKLQAVCGAAEQKPVYRSRPSVDWKPEVSVPGQHPAGTDLKIRVKCQDADRLWLRYRHTNQTEGAFVRTEMWKTSDGFESIVDGSYLTPEWDLLLWLETSDASGDGRMWPGIGNETEPLPYRIIKIVK